MCAGGAIIGQPLIALYGAKDYKGGAVESLFNVLSHPGPNHETTIRAGILADEWPIDERFL